MNRSFHFGQEQQPPPSIHQTPPQHMLAPNQQMISEFHMQSPPPQVPQPPSLEGNQENRAPNDQDPKPQPVETPKKDTTAKVEAMSPERTSKPEDAKAIEGSPSPG